MDLPRPARGPATRSIFGHVHQLGRAPLQFLTRCARDHGDLVELRILHRRIFLLSNPEAIESVLARNPESFRKSITYRTPLMRRMFGNGVFTSEGGIWSRQRKLLHAWLQGPRIDRYYRLLAEETENMIHRWTDGSTRDIHDDMQAMNSASFGRFLIRDIGPDERQALMLASSACRDRFTRQFSLRAMLGGVLPVPSTLRFRRITREVHNRLQRRIDLRRARRDANDDYLGHLLAHRDEHGRPLPDRLIRDELVTLFFAGSETTAVVLGWGLCLLACHPPIHDRAADEIRTANGDRPGPAGNAPPLPLLTNIVRETIRLYPPSWIVGREATRACVIGDFECDKGDTFLMSQWVLHRHPKYHARPKVFDPDRWGDPAIGNLPRFAYFPFGGGPRTCPGRSFAERAAVQVLARLLPQVRLKLSQTAPPEPQPSITLQPKDGIRAMITQTR